MNGNMRRGLFDRSVLMLLALLALLWMLPLLWVLGLSFKPNEVLMGKRPGIPS